MSNSNDPLVVVTGATGFIGGRLVADLLEQGYRVRALGRNLERGAELAAAGAEFRPVDLRDRNDMISACRGADGVIHAGAMAETWGDAQKFEAVNVEGTRHVIDGCRAHDVDRLVYVSSPSVTSGFEDHLDQDESVQPGPDFVSIYSRTKYEGEKLVRRAGDRNLATVIVRPKAVYGPGDTQILPRLLKMADRGFMPVIGDGSTVTNITHVEDAARGIRLALESDEAPGNTYVLTGEEEVSIQNVFDEVLTRLGEDPLRIRLGADEVMTVAGLLETAWRLFDVDEEPPLTRYTASIFVYSQTYDISAARRDLDYRPNVDFDEGMRRVVSYYEDHDPDEQAPISVDVPSRETPDDKTATSDVEVRLELMSAGSCTVPAPLFAPGIGNGSIRAPALFGLIDHPKRGHLLFDTGYSPRFYEATRTFPARIFRWATPADIDESTTALARLRARDIDPTSIDTILLSHFDPDHYGGLRDFPDARIVCTAKAWASIRHKEGLEALRSRLLPGHLPDDITGRLTLLPDFEGPSIGPFETSFDVFGDGSIRAVELPGHAPGQYGVFLNTDRHGDVFLAADGCWSRQTLSDRRLRGRAHHLIADDRQAQTETYRKLHTLKDQRPDLEIVPSHCPEAARQFNVWSKT